MSGWRGGEGGEGGREETIAHVLHFRHRDYVTGGGDRERWFRQL